MYIVRGINIGKSEQLDELARECGRLYSQTVIWFWRTVRHKGIWLKPSSMMRWLNSEKLHAHTADACVQAFFASLKSWRTRRKTDPNAKPPRRLQKFFRVEYKNSAIRHREGKLFLSNGRGNSPLVLDWPFETPRTVVIRWQGEQYEAIATYSAEKVAEPTGNKTAGVDLGEVHMAVAHDGENCTILNGRELRSVRRYQNKTKARLSNMIDTKKRGSKRRQRLIKSKRKQLRKLNNQIRDIEHKQTTALVSTLHKNGVQTVVIGDVRDIWQGLDYGPKANQKIHQMISGKTRFLLTYKCERRGMNVVLQEESYTTQNCPACGKRKKPKGREYVCSCGFRHHRDAVGSLNIRNRYLGYGSVVGAMAPPTGIRFHPHLSVARENTLREAAGF
ncbi:MAG: RNA-guided endonuclease InsQ/TnpB family protein [bacterium]